MPHILQVDFPYKGPWDDEMTSEMTDLANSIALEPGMIWKIWTVNETDGEAGGIYLFVDEVTAKRYLDMHRARLLSFGIPHVNAKIFDIHKDLSALNRAPIR